MVPIRPIALACGIALGLGLAQQRPAPVASTGLIVGQVVDAVSGAGVPGALVTIGTYAAPVPATAQLVDMNFGAPAPQNARRILTTESGRFLFRDLPAGRYEITVSGPGFAPSIYGQGRPSGPGQFIDLAEGQKLGGVAVRAWKLGVISGTVVDELGEPAVGVLVRYLRRVIAGGKPRFATLAAQGSATTDDRGMYRIAGLPPADYAIGVIFNPSTVPMTVVDANATASESGNPNASDVYRRLQSSVTSTLGATGFRVGDQVLQQPTSGASVLPVPAANGRLMTYQTTFYPAAAAPSQATLVTLRPGEERAGINLQLRLVPAVRVSGRITGPDGPGSFLGMTLVASTGGDYQSEGVAEAASGVSDATGAFTFLGIPPGEYVLKIRMYPRPVPTPATITLTTDASGTAVSGRATGAAPAPAMPSEPSLWAAMPITVGNTDLENIAVVLRHGRRVGGAGAVHRYARATTGRSDPAHADHAAVGRRANVGAAADRRPRVRRRHLHDRRLCRQSLHRRRRDYAGRLVAEVGDVERPRRVRRADGSHRRGHHGRRADVHRSGHRAVRHRERREGRRWSGRGHRLSR
jgi:hypothetical protein